MLERGVMDEVDFRFDAVVPQTGEPVEAAARYCPARRGLRDRHGVPLEPDDPEELILLQVRNRAGEPVPFGGFEDDLVESGLRAVHLGRKVGAVYRGERPGLAG